MTDICGLGDTVSANIEALKKDITRRMDGAVEVLGREFGGLRTGRANASLLEPVVVKAYGSEMPLNQVGTIGVPEPLSVRVDTFGTGTVSDRDLELAVNTVFDLRPAAIIKDLDLLKPQYRQLAAYGHMGREDLGVKWEETNRTAELLKLLESSAKVTPQKKLMAAVA